MKNILITGGAGFIGSHLALSHLQKGDSVVIVDDLSSGRLENINLCHQYKQFKFYKNDLLSWSELDVHISQADVVYHLAAMVGMFRVLANPLDTLNINVEGTKRLFDSICKLESPPLMVIASSSEVYGNQAEKLSETSPLILLDSTTGHESYTISKLYDEAITAAFHKAYQIPYLILRLFNTVGPRQSAAYGMVIPRFIEQALNNKDLTVFGDGSQLRSYCDVRDTVNIIQQLVANTASYNQIFNVGHTEAISSYNLAELVKAICDSESSIRFSPFSEVYGDDFNVITSRKPDLTKLLKFTNYQYNWTLTDTIKALAKS